MVDKAKRPRDPEARNGPEVIDLCDSDTGDSLARASVRDDAASRIQKHVDLGPRPKTSQTTKNSQDASRALVAASRTGSKSARSGSQHSRAGSQQRPMESSSSTQNSTLAQRVARRGSETHDRPSSRQTPQSASNSSVKASTQPASQVQIRRGLSVATSAVLSGTSPANARLESSSKLPKMKRRLENDGEIDGSPAVKKVKYSQRPGQSFKQPTTARQLAGLGRPSDSGIGSNPIVISDSPPPEEMHRKKPGVGFSADHQRTPKHPTPLTSKTAARASVATVPKLKATDMAGQMGNRRKPAGIGSNHMAKSPTIPESLPGSSPERDRDSVATDHQHTELPLFVRPSDRPSDEILGKDVDTISSFAEQAEAFIASQPDDTGTTAAVNHPEQSEDDQVMLRPSSSSMGLSHKAASQSTPRRKLSSARREHSKRAEQPTRDHNKRLALPAARNVGCDLQKTTPKDITPANHIEQVITKYVQELRDDNVYWTRTWLKRARDAVNDVPWSGHAPTSVFRDMQPIEPVEIPEDKRMGDIFARFAVDTLNGSGKSPGRHFALPCTMYRTPTDADVPNYSHFVNIKHSFLARNETVLQHWPYFHDEFDMQEAVELEQHYYLDIKDRERKLKRLAQAENYAEYVEDMLRDVECTWSDVLRFLLDPRPDVGTDPEARHALMDRDKFNDEDFVRAGQRWTTVLSKLPHNDADRVGRAALLCEYFKKVTRVQLWHVARRSDYTTRLLEEREPELEANELKANELTCRVCMRFSCPYHGEIHENASNDSDSERDGSAAEEVVETDIIHPWRVNYRSRVPFPSTVDAAEPGGQSDPRRKKLEYWQKQNLLHYSDDRRGPFYPCCHPGVTCEKAQCPCYENKTPCEKSCSCDSSCKRKWQGCECKMKGGRVCFEDSRCACFQNGRECDADLCGDCGVLDVLDPVHRHDETIVQGRCSNASIQRNVPRHTIIGDSGIHGLGLYACESIKQHDFVGEYKGEIITKDEAERRGAVYEHQKLSYLFTLNKKQEVDSTLFGNKVRFINHATEKQANLYARIIMVNTVFRIALYGARDIIAGQELLFDYGPTFPQDQLGLSKSKASKERKAAPHVRNKKLVAQFDEVIESFDKFGNRRARKAAAGDKRGRLASKGSEAGQGGGSRSLVARKSTSFQSGSHRGAVSSESGHLQRNMATDYEGTGSELNPLDDMDLDAGQRLSNYNVADDDGQGPVQPDDDEDDDFSPQSERRYEETSSIDGGDEDEEDDQEDEIEASWPARPRSSRRRY